MAWKIIGTFHTCGNTWKYELKNVKSNKISNILFFYEGKNIVICVL